MNGNVKTSAETQIQVAVGTLLETAADKSSLVSETVHTALRKIAKTHPNEVLKSCCYFYERNPKISNTHLSAVLGPMEEICRDHILLIDGDTLLQLVEVCLNIMTRNVLHEPQVQMPASGVLVALGTKHCIQVMEGLLSKLEVGVVPHYTIPHTLGSLAYANAFGVVPYLKRVLAVMLPLLAGIKTDTIRQAFAYALDRFSFAINEYTINLEQAPDPTITTEDFTTEMAIAYDVLFSVWLNARELKVIETVLHALAEIYTVLGIEKIRQHTLKMIQVLLSLNKKQRVTHASTKCLGSVISVAAKTDGMLLEPLLESILQSLSELVCIFPDYAQPELLRTHSEVLRCYECLATHFTDHTLDHLIAQLKNNNERDRVKSLLVLTHLTNSSDTAIRSRLRDVLNVLLIMLNENNIKVKRALMKMVVAFAYKGFLLNKDLPHEKFIEFLVKLCCKQQFGKEIDQQEIKDLQHSADNTLYMLTTSVQELETILWNLLLRCFLSLEYSDASIVLLRCLTHIASKGRIQETCEAAFIRCLGLLSHPIPEFRGTFILNFLRNVKISNGAAFKPVWNMKIPQLLKYLESNYDHFNEKEWEDMLFDLLNLLLEVVEEPEFKDMLVQRIKEQLALYSLRFNDIYTQNAEKRMLLKCLAIISCHLENKTTISEILDLILQSVKLNDMQGLQACSEAIGICSRSHLKLVLDKLQVIRRDVLLKKNKFFSFMKDSKNDAELERVRFVVISSYSEICNEAPCDALLQTIESEILEFVINELTNCKDFIIRGTCLKTIGAAADAMHPNRNKLLVRMQERDRILELVSNQMQLHSGPEYIELFPVILPVLTSLVRLPHVLESEQRIKLLKLCFDNVFNASAIYCKMTSDSYGDLKLAQYVHSSFSKLNILVQELLLKSLSPATIDEIVTLLEAWLGRKKAEQRLPAIEALRVALQVYLDNMKFAYEGPCTFSQTGLLLARIAPRCTDPNSTIRKVAVECVCLVLCIADRYEGHMRDNDKILQNALLNVRENIDTSDPKVLYDLTTDLANVIASTIPKHQLGHLVESLLDALMDIEPSSSTGASVILNTILKVKGGDLLPQVGDIMVKLLGLLEKIRCPGTKTTSLKAVHSFAKHHLRPTVGVILAQPLPFDPSVTNCWTIISDDASLTYDVLEQLKKAIKSVPLYEEQQNNDNIASLVPFQAVCALCELFKSPSCSETCKQQFAEVFSMLLVVLASYINTIAPANSSGDKKDKYSFIPNRDAYKLNPAKICGDAFKLFLKACDNLQASTILQVNDGFNMNAYLEMVEKLAENICMENSQSLAWLVACLGPYSRADYEPQRIAVIAFFSTVLKNKVNSQTVLTENILEMLLDVQADSSCVVRQLSLKGLGYAVEHLSNELVLRYCSGILNALLQGLDYHNISNESEVTLEAMLSFSKLLEVVDSKYLGQCHVTAAVRIRPLLEQENSKLRKAAFHLLGDLAASIGPHEAFREQVNGNLITLFLHLKDEDVDVVKACKHTLRKIGPLLESEKVNNMIQGHVLEEGNLHFIQFITDLVKVMTEDLQDLFPQLIMTCITYFKSPWMEIRGHAALLSGLFYSQLTEENKNQVSSDTVCYRLLQLLKDEQPEVRAKVVEAIAYIFVT